MLTLSTPGLTTERLHEEGTDGRTDLRRQVARASWWVLASTVGWVVGGFLSGAVPVGGFLGWAALEAVYGAITGTALVWLLRQRPPSFDQPSDA